MHIKFLLTQSLESPSGIGRYAPMAKELEKRGHDVTIIALHPEFDKLTGKSVQVEGVHVLYASAMHVRKSEKNKTYYPTTQLIPLMAEATVKLTRASLNNPADILHVCKPHPMNSLAGLTTTLIRGERLYLDCDDYEAASGRFSRDWQRKVVNGFEHWMPHRASCITTNTHFMQDKLAGWGIPPKKINYIPNGVERIRFKLPKEEELSQLRQGLALGGKKVIAYVGSLGRPAHPVDLLIQATCLVLKDQPDAVLLLVGGGEDYQYLQEMAKKLGIYDYVRFCGRIAPDQVSMYYHLADVSVEPVLSDDAARGRSPLKLFESWACGVPFVTADVGDRNQLLGTPPAGVLTKPGDAHSLAEGILHILNSPMQGEAMARLGRERVEQYYWDRLVERLEAVYTAKVDYER